MDVFTAARGVPARELTSGTARRVDGEATR